MKRFQNGWGWEDCTIIPRTTKDADPRVGDDANEEFINGFNKRMRDFMPSFSRKSLSCDLSEFGGEGTDVYAALTNQIEAAPTKPFTKINFSLERIDRSESGTETIYKLVVSNKGDTNAEEINFRSILDTDTHTVSVQPSQGRCQSSTWGTSWGSEVCFLGLLKVGGSATVVFKTAAGPPGFSGDLTPGRQNENWHIFGYTHEHSGDPKWPINLFEVWPLKSPNQ
jgi:hypothetical protein